MPALPPPAPDPPGGAPLQRGFWTLSPPVLLLLPSLVALPVLLALPSQVHAGGFDLIGRFLLAAVVPSFAPLVWRSAIAGLGVTLAMALLGWTISLLAGLVLGLGQLPFGVVGVRWFALASRCPAPRSGHPPLHS